MSSTTVISRALRAAVKNLLTRAFGSQLRRNMASGVVLMAVSTLVVVVSYPIYLHYLGYEKYGVWLVLGAVLSFLEMGGNLGITPAVTKLVAEEYGRKDIRGIESYVTMALVVLGLSGSVGLGIVLLFRSEIIAVFRLSGDNAEVASWLLPYIGVLCLYAFLVRCVNATLSGLGRMDLANYGQTSGRIVAMVVAVTLLFQGRGIESLLAGVVSANIMVHIWSIILIRRIVRLRILRVGNWERRRFRRLFQFGGGVFGSSLLAMLVGPFNKLMLSRYAGVATVPIFELAYRGAVMLRSLFESALRAMMPEISRLNGEATAYARERIKVINWRAMKMIGLFALPTYGVLLLAAELLLKLWLRDRYRDAIPGAFRIMLIGTFLNLLCVPAFHTLMGLGKVRYCLVSSIIIAGINFVLVITFQILTSRISVNTIGFCLTAAFGVSAGYIIHKAYHSLSWK